MADLVARVLVEGRDVGLELLKQGPCWVHGKYFGEAPVEIQTSYRTAQSAPRSGRLGL
jgi:endonuclease YncB( thermonuclease family)